MSDATEQQGETDREATGRAMRVIAIDGPAGAGKSTIGKALARRLGLSYLDTGAMYRAVTFAAVRAGVPLDDPTAVGQIARQIDLHLDEHRVLVDGVDATAAIRTAEITAAVSVVAAQTPVRDELRQRQRDWAAQHGGGVIEGRDIGTVVFPDAEAKLYLTASPRVRAERRVAEAGGDLDEIEAAIARRDELDSTRADSPLRTASQAIVVDTTGLTVDEVLERIDAILDPASPARDDASSTHPADGASSDRRPVDRGNERP